jgi:hypothetical protein
VNDADPLQFGEKLLFSLKNAGILRFNGGILWRRNAFNS